MRDSTNALYSASGHLLFMDGDTLMAQAFDAINTLAADLPPVSITVVLKWTAGLKK